MVPGHEYAGVIDAVGAGVTDLSAGDPVTAEGMLYCGVCEACRRGSPNQCPRLQMTGFSAAGAFAEHVVVQARSVWSLASVAERVGLETALEWGALIEPLACSYNGIWIAGDGLRPGDHVVVYGCGPIGLGAILLARAAGAATITAFDVVEERVALATACGADEAICWTGQDAAAIVRGQTRGWGADLQIEAAGAASQTMPAMEAALAPGGQILYLGRTGGCAPVQLDVLVSGAGKLVGSRGHAGGGCYPALIRLLAHGRLDPSPLITARFGLEQGLDAIRRSVLRTDGKILVRP